MNVVILTGRLGQNPEVRYMPSGDAVCNFSIPDTVVWKDKASGERKEKTDWFDCVMFGSQVEHFTKWCKKGTGIEVRGSLRKSTYEKGDHKVTKYEIHVDAWSFAPGTKREDAPSQASGSTTEQAAAPAKTGAASKKPVPSFADMDDHVPF